MKKISFILLVDDDPIANYLTEKLLDKLLITAKIRVAINGEQALDIIKEEDPVCPDLILLDINMPVMNGLEFLQMYTKGDCMGNKKAQIAVLTTSTHPEDFKEITSYGINYILEKPLTEEKILEVLEKANTISK